MTLLGTRRRPRLLLLLGAGLILASLVLALMLPLVPAAAALLPALPGAFLLGLGLCPDAGPSRVPLPVLDRSAASATRRVIDHVSDMVLLLDRDCRVRRSNRAAEALLGLDGAELRGRALADLLMPWNQAGLAAMLESTLVEDGRWEGELYLRSEQGVAVATQAVIAMLHRDEGDAPVLIAVCRDLRERKAAEARIEYMARFDPLTALPNRVLFRDRLEQALNRAHGGLHRVAVTYIDVDNFGLVNEGLGHAAGDILLQALADRLRHVVRSGETLARIGGDKFALIQENLIRPDQAVFRIRHALDLIEPPMVVQGRDLNVSASMGIAVHPEDGQDADELLRNASLALTRAKTEGRGGYRFYVHGMDEETRLRCALEHDINGALERAEFEFHYQPQVELASGRVIGCEALVRWRHPEYGLLYPDQFIAVAEESGSILAIGRWGLREACRQLAAWRDDGMDVERMAVNLSALQFRDEELEATLRRILQETGAEAHRLELEITETVALDRPELAARVMERIGAMGVRFAIDDFGVGYSSLNSLKRFPIRVLKVDRSLLSDPAGNACDAAIIRSVIDLGHTLQMHVLAEGIERTDQLDFLRRSACDLGQGRSFSEALPPAAFERFMRRTIATGGAALH